MSERPAESPPVTKRSSPTNRLLVHLELADPVTWISPITMVIGGAIAAGRGNPGFQFTDTADLLLLFLAILMCGPFGTGFSQSINDYFDRDLDAINDPARPIPAGRISLGAARANWIVLGLATMIAALFLATQNIWVPVIAAIQPGAGDCLQRPADQAQAELLAWSTGCRLRLYLPELDGRPPDLRTDDMAELCGGTDQQRDGCRVAVS
jgi:hypothetical protein